MKNNFSNLYLVPIFTLLVGFIPFLVLSIINGVFWIDSKYDIPLIYNASVMIGDSILLPIINYKTIELLLKLNVFKIAKKTLIIWLVCSLMFSVFLNIFTHLSWVNDEYTDFVGFSIGVISFIGYWHLIFSILQMIIFLLFPYLWFTSIKLNNQDAKKKSFNIWIFFFLYTSLNILDILNKYLFVYDNTFVFALKKEGFPLNTLVLAVLLLVIMKLINKSQEKCSGNS